MAYSEQFLQNYCVLPGAWMVTCGSNAGVVKCVGEAVRQHTITQGVKKNPIATIGIAVLGSISNRDVFERNPVRIIYHLLCVPDLPTFEELCDTADDQLFNKTV